MTSADERRPRAGEHGTRAPRPLYAVVGATDLAVERAKEAVGDVRTLPERVETGAGRIGEELRRGAEKIESKRPVRPRRSGRPKLGRPRLDPAELRERARRAQSQALMATAQAAGRAEQEYERLAERGKDVMDKLLEQPGTQNLLAQGKDTWERTVQAVEVARRTVDEKTGEALSTIAARRAAHRAKAADAAPAAPAAPADLDVPEEEAPSPSRATRVAKGSGTTRPTASTRPRKSSGSRTGRTSASVSAPPPEDKGSGTARAPRTGPGSTARTGKVSTRTVRTARTTKTGKEKPSRSSVPAVPEPGKEEPDGKDTAGQG